MNAQSRVEPRPGTVELQLLRPGPPHNQLLSPLTEYLALCGDHTNTTLRIPLEHAALETRLRAMRYFDSEETRIDQLRETARIASELFAKVPGLIADLSSNRAGGKPFVHLSIVSRASELAIFPFELALAPDGFPGTGQPIFLQKQLPVCLTRRSTNVRNDDFEWDRPVKILMVASDAGGEIPVQQHYALLRKLTEPWIGTKLLEDAEESKRLRRRVLRLLTQANVDAIQRTICDEVYETGKPFTHIHVLAHGCDLPESDRRSGVAFHLPIGRGMDVVDGKRLAQALGCLPDYPASRKQYSIPTVVTLATCGSADQGGVTISGASLAFELHDSGIPLVVGSQFPLSSDGSILMTESLYRGFLSGRDPRSVIWDTRQSLQSNLPQLPGVGAQAVRTAHDWASLTVYAALPRRLDDVLSTHRRNRQRARMDVRLRNIRWAKPETYPETLKDANISVDKFGKWVRKYGSETIESQVINEGILASAQKQIGLLYLRAARDGVIDKPERPQTTKDASDEWPEKGKDFLKLARQTYRHVFELRRDESWALVQFLAINFAIQRDYDEIQWTVGRELSAMEEHVSDIRRQLWALSSLLELRFLKWMKSGSNPDEVEASRNLATRIRDSYSDSPWEVFSAYRQFCRYIDDFPYVHPRGVDGLKEALDAIKDVMQIFDGINFRELMFE